MKIINLKRINNIKKKREKKIKILFNSKIIHV
jgi:hypothetical protein